MGARSGAAKAQSTRTLTLLGLRQAMTIPHRRLCLPSVIVVIVVRVIRSVVAAGLGADTSRMDGALDLLSHAAEALGEGAPRTLILARAIGFVERAPLAARLPRDINAIPRFEISGRQAAAGGAVVLVVLVISIVIFTRL
ncbi:hypothetical protein PG997_004712 [Apiospora hydei]|uniref:Uncharacterized protein n=1 Tax=Apiospora hydei TaxID=1337664 RepID=A0ABR1X2V5_9PEZI